MDTQDGERAARKAETAEALGKVKSAYGDVSQAIAGGVGVGAAELAALRDEIAKLTQAMSQFVRSGAASAQDQMTSAVGAASDNLSQSATAAQEKLTTVEADLESRIKNHPWTAVAIAVMLGVLIGRLS